MSPQEPTESGATPEQETGELSKFRCVLRALRARLEPWRPWLVPAVALVLMLVALLTLWGKLRSDVWAYYTDDEGLSVDVEDEKLRPVLWEDPQLNPFDATPAGGEADSDSGALNAPTGRLEASFSADGTKMALVRQENGKTGNADIFLSQWDGRVWSRPVALSSVNTPANERGPAFSRDGKYLYFASDREGGRGGYDIHVARWNGREWGGITALGPNINTGDDELGPAPSADGSRLYFSTKSSASGTDDIFVAQKVSDEKQAGDSVPDPKPEAEKNPTKDQKNPTRKKGRQARKNPTSVANAATDSEPLAMPGIPRFAKGQSVDDLNSEAADLQAALTTKGDHVFLASDRDRDGDRGFGVYFSRVVDGEVLPPERVDLYIDRGDVTDPAVRMEGFDLLFSSDYDPSADDQSTADEATAPDGYRLYRSTTREVIGYTDLERWDQFKELMNNIVWWLLLFVVALIALIYLLERWQDITSLFHKCLGASAAIHLLVLLLMTLWFIAKEIDSSEEKTEDIELTLDALAQEELAEESAPEQAEMTESQVSLVSQKAESDFELPESQPQQVDNEFAAESKTERQTSELDVKPAKSALTDQAVPPPVAAAASFLSNLSDPVLLEVETPDLEERDPNETEQANANPVDPARETFEPVLPEQPTTEKAEAMEVVDNAVDTPADASQVSETAEPVSLNTTDSAITNVEPTAAEAPSAEPVVESSQLDSPMLEALSEVAMVDLGDIKFEESDPNEAPAGAPADSSKDIFDPGEAASEVSGTKAEGEAVADNAVASSAEAAQVDGGSTAVGEASALSDIQPLEVPLGSQGESVPDSSVNSSMLGGLPDSSIVDPGAPTLEESDPSAEPPGAPANPSDDLFNPATSGTKIASEKVDGQPATDSALANPADSQQVASGNVVEQSEMSDVQASAVGSTSADPTLPEPGIDSGLLGGLPDSSLPDTGAPQLEESNPTAQPPGSPADPTKDLFTPGTSGAKLASKQAEGKAIADDALANPADSSQVDGGSVVGQPQMSDLRPSVVGSSSPGEAVPESGADSELLALLPATGLLDPGAPTLEETGPAAGPVGAPADTSKDLFTPGSGISSVATTKAEGKATAESAIKTAATGAEVAAATTPGSGKSSEAPSAKALESQGSLPEAGPGNLPGIELVNLDLPSVLPGRLETPDGKLDSGTMAKVVRSQQGKKPSAETVRELGGSDGTEESIKNAVSWLAKNQEEDGRWDTRKHDAKSNYDTGGTGLALLCFFGWGERHDRPGKYQDQIRKGVEWLVSQQAEDGNLGGAGLMYCHSIASIALCEAYGITRDPTLKEPVEKAIAYTLAAQHPVKGGWRYNPGDDPDTSITAWQSMALHSARMAGIKVPDEALEGVQKWLNRAGGGKHGGYYGYRGPSKNSPAMVAAGMFCRQLELVPPTDPKMIESARFLKMHPMKASNFDTYYVYYATLSLYQHQGPIWQQWNEQLKKTLPLLQKKTGAREGSWDPSAGITAAGGRVASTALATLSLEVYYHLLPMYGLRKEDLEPAKVKSQTE